VSFLKNQSFNRLNDPRPEIPSPVGRSKGLRRVSLTATSFIGGADAIKHWASHFEAAQAKRRSTARTYTSFVPTAAIEHQISVAETGPQPSCKT
jgi:hypothetical protein